MATAGPKAAKVRPDGWDDPIARTLNEHEHSKKRQLRNDRMKHFAADVGQPKTTAVVLVRQASVVDAQQMQNCGVQIIDVHLVDGCLVTDLVRFAVGRAAFDPASSQPCGETVWVVVSTWLGCLLGHRQPTKFTAPNDKRVLQKPSLLEIRKQTCDRRVGLASELTVVAMNVVVAIP